MYGPPLIDAAYSNPPAPITYTAGSALSLPPQRTASNSLHAAPLSASSPTYYSSSLYSFPISGYLPPASSSSSSSSYSSLPNASPPALSLFSSPHSSPHSSHLSGRSTPPSVSNLQAVLDAADQLDSQVADEPTAMPSGTSTRARPTEAVDGSKRRKRRQANQPVSSASHASSSHSLPSTPTLSLPPPPLPPVSLTEAVDRQSLISAFAVPPSAFASASWNRQWLRQRKQLFRSYVGAPLTDPEALLVSLLRRAARVFAQLGGGRTASGEKVEQYRVERELLLALFASELPLPLVSSLFDVSSSGVRRLLEQTGAADELESYINQAKQKRLAKSSTSSQLTGSASSRLRNLICKRTGRPMRDENAFAQSFFDRPQLAQADISTVWQQYVRETTAAGGGDGVEATSKPPLSRAHFFTLAPEERRRKRKQQSDCTVACEHCGAVKQADADEAKQQQTQARAENEKMTKSDVKAVNAAVVPLTKRAKQQPHSDATPQQAQLPAAPTRKAGRPKRAVQRSSLTSEMRALLPALLAEQSALHSETTPHEHRSELAIACS